MPSNAPASSPISADTGQTWSAARPSSRWLLLALLAATAMAYLVTLRFEFVYDDLGQIVGNPAVQSWRYFPRYFHANVWMQQTPVGNYYRPVFLTWLLLNHSIFGLHPFWWHLTTVLAHMGATALVFLLAFRLTRDRKIAALAGLLFGLHPVHLESVAWISGVTEPLLALTLIPAFLGYLNFRERHSRKWMAASLALYALALLTKETAIVLPLLIAAYHLLCPEENLGGSARNALRGAAPYAGIATIYLLVRAAALQGLAHTTVNLAPHITLLTIPSALWFYLKLLVAPWRLSPFYDTPYVTHVSWKYFLAPLLGIMVSAALVVMAWRKRRSPLVAFAGLWILLPLIPVLYLPILPMGDFVHDRYLYLPSVGFCLLAAIALTALDTPLAPNHNPRPSPFAGAQGRLHRAWTGHPFGAVTALLIAGAMAVGTVAQSSPWTDDLQLYKHGMAVAPNNDLPRNKFAATLVQRGMYEQGIRAYEFVLATDPDYWYAHYRMGVAQYMSGHYAEAERHLAKAVSLHATPDEFYYLGLSRMKLGQNVAAEAVLREAVRLQPNLPPYSLALGMVLKEQGKVEAALESFRAVLALKPDDPEALAQVSELEGRAVKRTP